MNSIELLQKAVTNFENTLKSVTEEQAHTPTPCTEWDVHALVNHIANELSWIPDLVADKTVAEVGSKYDGDLLGSDPLTAFQKAAREAVTAFSQPGALDRTVHLSFGDTPGSEYCNQTIADLTVHGWDLAKAVGGNTTIDSDLLEAVDTTFTPLLESGRQARVLGPEIEVPENADQQTRVLAKLGRQA